MPETQGTTAPLRNAMLKIMAQGRLRIAHLIAEEAKGPAGLTEAEARAILASE